MPTPATVTMRLLEVVQLVADDLETTITETKKLQIAAKISEVIEALLKPSTSGVRPVFESTSLKIPFDDASNPSGVTGVPSDTAPPPVALLQPE